MQKTTLTIMLIIIAIASKAQLITATDSILLQKMPNSKSDFSIKPSVEKLQKVIQSLPQNKTHNYSMPNVINPNEANRQHLIGNNGKGFDIYKDELDGMIILKPDSTNKTAPMGLLQRKILPKVSQIPDSIVTIENKK